MHKRDIHTFLYQSLGYNVAVSTGEEIGGDTPSHLQENKL